MSLVGVKSQFLLQRADAADDAVDQRDLFLLLLRRGWRSDDGLDNRGAFGADDLYQPRLQQAVDDAAHLQVVQPGGAGDLAHGVLGIDEGDHFPLVDAQVDVAQIGAGSLDEFEGHIQAGDLILQLLLLAHAARALDDQVLQADAHGDLVFRRAGVVFELEEAVCPGEQAVDNVNEVRLQAGEDVLLVEVTGVDQQQSKLFIADIPCFLLDDLALSRAELVSFEQDRRQAVIAGAILSVGQLALSEIDLDGLARPLDNQAAGLARQIYQIQELRDGEIAKVTLKRHEYRPGSFYKPDKMPRL